MSPQGVVCVKQDSALTTHVLLIRPGASDTRGSVHGGGVSPALGLGVPPQPDVAILAPECSPAVPHNPVITVAVRAVADQLHGVVHSDVGVVVAAIIDTSVVTSPATDIKVIMIYSNSIVILSPGVHRDGEGSDLGEVLHDGVLVVGGEHVVPSEADSGGHAVIVIATVPGHSVAGGVSRVRI